MTNSDRIIEVLRASSVPLDDDELSRRCGIAPRQTVNQICRRLASEGVITRRRGAWGKIVNALKPEAQPPSRSTADRLSQEPTSAVTDSAPGTLLGGSSLEQRQAEGVILALLGERLGIALAPRRLSDPTTGARVEIDGASDDLTVLVECWAHQGTAKVAQKYKLVNDAAKLQWISTVLDPQPQRLILCVTDDAAVHHLRGQSWQGAAIRSMGVEIEVVELPPEVKERVIAAQRRQFR